ncbi:MAG: hypothetical protein A3J28_14525 [Acidobacteria bacterium RIFCSPLOWO2_12_FULL_60_22]|nr:MAG: hypothetical protein A3J28_14525 [Acidobacteria bacterium RIFCSPLOWO2_12_FULL_60_22]
MPNFGRIFVTSTSSRQIQFALKYVFWKYSVLEEVQERMNKEKLLGTVGLVVFTMFSFNLPIKAQSQKEGAPLSEKAQKGKAIFNDRCFVCHDVDSVRVKPLGPTLNGLFKRDKLVVGKPVTEENVKEVIKTGPTPGMPAFRYTLSDQEIDDLVAYLKVK